jgi:hypothetical protein
MHMTPGAPSRGALCPAETATGNAGFHSGESPPHRKAVGRLRGIRKTATRYVAELPFHRGRASGRAGRAPSSARFGMGERRIRTALPGATNGAAGVVRPSLPVIAGRQSVPDMIEAERPGYEGCRFLDHCRAEPDVVRR